MENEGAQNVPAFIEHEVLYTISVLTEHEDI